MDYLNYGKQVQKQPQQQKPKPQVFLQDFNEDLQLTKNDFMFGDLGQNTIHEEISQEKAQQLLSSAIQGVTQPKVEPPKDELINLFITPLSVYHCPFDYGRELEWIKKQPMKKCRNELQLQLNHQSEDTFILDKPEMSRVRQFIESKLKHFVSKIMGSDDEMVITQSWLNRNNKGESHHEHKHPNSMFSGVWYPQIYESSPPIQFKRAEQRDVGFHVKEFNMFNSQSFLLSMKMGELIMFPSNLIHSVSPNYSDEERISLSFNTWPKGNMGDKKDLTYLPLDRCV